MLTVVRGRTGGALVDALGRVLARPLPDPLAVEHVAVHTRGMERWVSQQLSQRLGVPAGSPVPAGVCANVAFPLPEDVVARVMTAAGTPAAAVRAWHPRSLTWRLLQLVEGGLPPVLSPLQDRVAAAGDRRLVPLDHVARHLHRYAVHRPDMVLDWLAGGDGDGAGGSLPDEHTWQAELVRMLAHDIGLPTYPEQVVATVAALADGAPLPAGLHRLALFGFTAIPSTQLAVLSAVAERIDLSLLLLHPSPTAWAAGLGQAGTVDGRGLPILPPRGGEVTPPATNRLLAAWGRDVRELQVLVQTVAGPAAVTTTETTTTDDPPAIAGGTLLQRLQAAVVADEQPTPDPGGPDDSLQVHACPGPARQVQVLRDEVLRLLAADPTLHPRDVVVMCPDVETFAPLVAAHLAGGGPGRPDLRVRLADRALRQTNPLLRTLADLLDLAATRLTASRLRDLLASPPVRRRFGLSEDDLEDADRWLEESGVRWGTDASDRERFRLGSVAVGTVRSGLDRLLLGVAMADEDLRSIGGTTPYDDVEGSSVRAVGRLAELANRLQHVLTLLRQPRSVAAWAEVLGTAVDLLALADPEAPAQRIAVTQLLQEIAADGAATTADVGLDDIRDLLHDGLQGRPSRANHMTGDLTVCTLVPMRTIPHRVVCLLGMDDQVFPRTPHPHVDDLVATLPRVGDRDPRTEDRQLLLDALMAAGDHLVITYTGIDARTGTALPPCTPVAELLRTVDAMAPAADGKPLSAQVTTTHPLNAHDPAAFRPDRPSFDAQAHRTASATTGTTPPPTPPSLPRPDRTAAVALADLERFALDPAGTFVRETLGLWVPDDPEAPDESIPVRLDGLQAWQVAEALREAGAIDDDAAADRVLAALRGQGWFPPEPLVADALQGIRSMLHDLAATCEGLGLRVDGGGDQLDVDVDVDGRPLRGVVGCLADDRLVDVSYSRLTGKRIMRAWIRQLALTLAAPERPWAAVIVGRDKRNRRDVPGTRSLPPLGGTPAARRRTAEESLATLLDLYDDGRCEPLIAPESTAHAYACARLDGLPPADADLKAADRWDPDDRGWSSDSTRPVHVLLLGDVRTYEHLAAQPPRPQDLDPDGVDEPHRFGALAMRLWGPPLRQLQEHT